MSKFRLALLVVGIAVTGCGSGGYRDYDSTVRSARTTLPMAVELERQYGSADHFITHYGFRTQKTNTWNTEVFFGGRYTLTMKVEIEIDYGNNSFTRVGDPKFYLLETVSVDTGSRMSITFGMDKTLSAEEWESVYEHRGDFSVIGVEINNEPVAGFDEYVNRTREPRRPIRLLDK